MSSSAYSASLNLSNKRDEGYRYGNMFNLPGEIRSNAGSVLIKAANVGFDMSAAIGCGGIDLEGAFKGMIDGLDPAAITQQVKDYFTTGLANYLLTQVYSSPALAAIFDSLEAFGNARVSMMQQKCMSLPELEAAGAEAWAARNGANECVKTETAKGESGAACFDDAKPEFLKGFVNDAGKDSNMATSLYTVLGIDSSNTIANFLPDFKFCTKSGGRCSYDNKTKKEEKLSPSEQLTVARGGAAAQATVVHGVVAYVVHSKGADAVREKMAALEDNGVYQNLMVADVNERSFTNPFISNIMLDVADIAVSAPTEAGNKYSQAWVDLSKVMPSLVKTEEDKDFARFINCTSSDFALDITRIIDTLETPTNIRFAVGNSLVSPNAGDKFNFPVVAPTYYDMLDHIETLNGTAKENAETAINGANLLGIAVGCVYNHNMHMHPSDYVDLVEMGESKANGVISGISEQISFLAVETVLRYMKHKLLDSTAAGVMQVPEIDPMTNQPVKEVVPISQQVLMAVNMVADDMENRIRTLKAVRDAQQTFSDMMAEVHKIK